MTMEVYFLEHTKNPVMNHECDEIHKYRPLEVETITHVSSVSIVDYDMFFDIFWEEIQGALRH